MHVLDSFDIKTCVSQVKIITTRTKVSLPTLHYGGYFYQFGYVLLLELLWNHLPIKDYMNVHGGDN